MEVAEISLWVVGVIALSPVWGALAWELWNGKIRPSFIPKYEIESEVHTLYDRYGDEAFDRACTEEHSAWHRSETYQQGRWRRIRREIMRRERAAGFTFSKVRR